MDRSKIPHKSFSDPRVALEHVAQDTYRQELIDRIEQIEEEGWENAMSFPRWVFMEEAFNPHRFDQISVMVIDYEMPGMRGLEVCERLQNPSIRKILLTGVADEAVAIDAFNKGLIDQFVRKQDSTFLTQLQNAITKAQRNYFLEICQTPLKILAKSIEPTALGDPTFAKYFDDLVQKHHIQEYYLVDQKGTCLMIDDKNTLHSLIVTDKGLSEAFLDSQEDNAFTPDLQKSIKKAETICAYFDPFHSPHAQPDNPKKWLRKAEIVSGQNQDYSVVFEKGLIQVNPKKIAFLG